MGVVERTAVYVLMLIGAPKAIGAHVVFKTAIRWPKLDDQDGEGHVFAEAFFLAMLFNMAIAVTAAWIVGADLTVVP